MIPREGVERVNLNMSSGPHDKVIPREGVESLAEDCL